MENNVVTLETAKKLKTVGFPQKTVNVWEWSGGIPAGEAYLWQPEIMKRYGLWGSQDVKESAAAPTAQELADQLPPMKINLEYGPSTKVWFATYDDLSATTTEVGDTMAEALALLWLKLQEASGDNSPSGRAGK